LSLSDDCIDDSRVSVADIKDAYSGRKVEQGAPVDVGNPGAVGFNKYVELIDEPLSV
jgi:hypothetical protein